MRRRLVVSYLSLAAIVLLMLEIPLGLLSARRERDQLAGQAQRDAQALAVLAAEDLEHPATHDLTRLAARYRGETGGEVAIVDAAAQPVIRLDASEQQAIDSDLQPEVHHALSGTPATGARTDEGHPVMTAAVPIRTQSSVAGAVVISVPADSANDHIRMIWSELAVVAFGVLAVTAVVSLWLARSLTRPLALLESAVSRLGHGELSVRAEVDAPSEVAALADEFNRMAARLEDLVTAQQRFVADASHQLRSPLTALRLRLENLEVGPAAPGNANLEAAVSEVLRLSRLVDGLLALSRAEGSRVDREAVDVAEIVAGRCDAWMALADERQVGLVAEVANRSSTLAWLVPEDLDQMLDNLLANAVDATPAGRGIKLLVTDDHGVVAVHVADEGPGMTAEERRRAFDRFWQGPGEGGHSGLGLAIVRQLAHRNGGEVELLVADGGGLDVVIRLQQVTTKR